jgi:hypothetical protein
MNAFNTVNMAAACIVTSTQIARALGIPEEAWIYPVGGAGRDDNEECVSSTYPGRMALFAHPHLVWKRPNYYSSRSLSQSLDAALHDSRLLKGDIDLFDFYSYGDMPLARAGLC